MSAKLDVVDRQLGALAEDLAAIDTEGETAAGCVGIGEQFDLADADLAANMPARNHDIDIVQRLLAGARRPP